MTSLGLLLLRSVRFVLVHSWPVMAVVALYLPVQLLLEVAQTDLRETLALGESPLAFTVTLLALVILNALIDAIYYSILLSVIWSKLQGLELSYSRWRERTLAAAWPLFVFLMLYQVVWIFSIPLAMIPLMALFATMPLVMIMILFESQPLGPAVRRNLSVLKSAPGPLVALGLAKFALLAWTPFLLAVSEVGKPYPSVAVYVGLILCVPIDVALLASYSFLSLNKPPLGFFSDPVDD